VGLPPKEKGPASLIRQVREAVRAVELKSDGTRLTGSARLKLDFAPLLKAIAEEASIRADKNKLRQIGLAFPSYRDPDDHFRAQAIWDAKGKPLLSWRVAILPFIEEEALYRQFKLDEPWDSPHNKKLIPLMPKTYAAPKRIIVEPGL